MLYIPGSFLLGELVGVIVEVLVGDGGNVAIGEGVTEGTAVIVAAGVLEATVTSISVGIKIVSVGLAGTASLLVMLTSGCETAHPEINSVTTRINGEIRNDFIIHPLQLPTSRLEKSSTDA